MKKLILILSTLFLISCTDDNGSKQALENAGYSNIELTGYEMFGCGGDDTFSTGFRATNPAGNRVSGVVCCGVLKGCTIRF